MSQLTIAGDAPAITSREIAELVEKRHDNVKRTIETLVQQGVIVRPQMAEKPGFDSMGRARPVRVFHFAGEQGMRDSLVVVAQLSPEFTGRLVDRWQELERRVAAPAMPSVDLTDPTALRSLLANYTDRVGGPPAGASSFNKASLKAFSGLRTRSVP
ncbi:Rha family transcriptional regulator [Xanthomonas campestris pv. campestris]|nr:Rha family transcriptional regulator [Xanthomonas campestris pv. campestris]